MNIKKVAVVSILCVIGIACGIVFWLKFQPHVGIRIVDVQGEEIFVHNVNIQGNIAKLYKANVTVTLENYGNKDVYVKVKIKTGWTSETKVVFLKAYSIMSVTAYNLDAVDIPIKYSAEILEITFENPKNQTRAAIPKNEAFVKYRVRNFFLKDAKGNILNNCGDLQCEDKAYAWDKSEWFSGERGETTFQLGFNDSEYGFSDIHFVNAQGNRPFPFQASSRGTMRDVKLSQGLMLSAEVFLERFEHNNTFLRMALVVHIKEGDIYLEADLKDSPLAKAIMPFKSEHCYEDIYTDLPFNQWHSVEVDMTLFAKKFGIKGTIDACYLVVESLTRR